MYKYKMRQARDKGFVEQRKDWGKSARFLLSCQELLRPFDATQSPKQTRPKLYVSKSSKP